MRTHNLVRSAIFLLPIILLLIAWAIPPEPNPGTSSSSQSQTAPLRDGFCLAGCPSGAPQHNILVTHHILTLSDDPSTKFADWVAYKITQDTLGSGCKRTWQEDPDLPPSATLRPDDYKGLRKFLASDRGHQAPLASLCGSPYWAEADYLSNITPQKTDLNEGAWEHLENAERHLIKAGVTDTVYSITGPLFEKEMPSLPFAHLAHKVPSGYWKVVSLEKGQKIEAAAFYMDQNISREADYCSTSLGLTELETRTHLTFFPQLEAQQKAALESNEDRMLILLECR